MRPNYTRYDTTMNIKLTITNPRNCKVLTCATKRFLTIGFCGCCPSNKWPNSARGWRNRIRSQRRKGLLCPETYTIWGEITSTSRQSSTEGNTVRLCRYYVAAASKARRSHLAKNNTRFATDKHEIIAMRRHRDIRDQNAQRVF